MRTFAVSTLTTAVRSLADLANDNHVSDTEIRSWLSTYWAELYDILVSSGLAYYESDWTLVSTGTNTFPMPTNFYGMIRLDYKQDSETWIPVREINPKLLHRVRTTGDRAYFYRTVGGNLVLYPTPPAGQTYRMLYIPAPVDLTSATQVIDGQSGWEDYVIVGAAMYGLQKQGRHEDKLALEGRFKALKGRITEAAQNRAIASAGSLVEAEDPGMVWDDDPSFWRHY